MSFTVATLNLWHDDLAYAERLEATAQVLVGAGVDVVALQENRFDADGSAAQWLATRCGYAGIAEVSFQETAAGKVVGNAVLSRRPITESWEVRYDGVDAGRAARGAVVAATTSPGGHTLLMASTHLAWGGAREAQRLEQLRTLERALQQRCRVAEHEIVVLGLDANAGPDADSQRYLRGELASADEVQWVDAWTMAPEGARGVTVELANPWAAHVAGRRGIEVTAGPPGRRQDFLYVRGWAWGGLGGPVMVRRLDEAAGIGGQACLPSDHYGVVATLAE